MTDYASIIKQSVTMPQILAQYGYETPRGRRIPCPIHHGEKRNFSYRDDRFHCYVCGAHGTVIDFVMQLYGLSFTDAMKRIDQDCGLGLHIGERISDEQAEQQRRACEERIAARRARQAERNRLMNQYHAALDRYIQLDLTIQEQAPKTPFDSFSNKYVTALKQIDAARYAVDEAERKLWEFEKAVC